MIEQHPSSDSLRRGRLALISLIAVTNTMLEKPLIFSFRSFGDSETSQQQATKELHERIQRSTADINENLRYMGGLTCSLDINGNGEKPFTLNRWHGNEDGLMKWSVDQLPQDSFVRLSPSQLISELRALHS